MDERLDEAIRNAHSVALVLTASEDPFQRENGQAIDTLIEGFDRLRKVALATGIPEVLVDKIALNTL